MKKFRFVSMLALAVMLVVGATSCKPKDADIKKAVETALAANPDAAGVTVDVQKQVVTLTGEVKDDATKVAINGLAAAVKNVKSVTNNLTLAPPPVNPMDEALKAGLVTALKDNAGVTFDVKDGVVTIMGEVKKADVAKIMQKISALKPGKIENKLTVK